MASSERGEWWCENGHYRLVNDGSGLCPKCGGFLGHVSELVNTDPLSEAALAPMRRAYLERYPETGVSDGE